ncbi:type II toxin-antitoxin system VapC family toxin [Caenispirillum bisanense]|uniref:Ribonuclease VapC n=1 Tax=Caenispirillum bisanense TaxID=414052 RepID=A0A286GNV0_9PROT|nr:type II toxin-antitoxin system VapC family toxin [Caenispirillum bisanense]SOD97182.1 ribonuclease VapC [Caenispirillum bisanense]
MIIDTSALVAILQGEDDAVPLMNVLTASSVRLMSAANYLELGIVIDKLRDPAFSGLVDHLLTRARIEIAPVTADQARLAREAYRRYGRGSGHAAKLNFGDCFAYALAKDRDQPLLFKGDDFSHTDVRRMPYA